MQKSQKTERFSRTFLISVFFSFLFIPFDTCLADKGGWNISTEPVTLTESGQRAIIGWGGETEILYLATDVSSSENTTVIEFLPLPSEPNVTLGKRESFEAVEKLLARRNVKLEMPSGGGLGPPEESEPFHITFHERLGAHDITVVKVNRPDEFADWIQEKAKALTQGQVSLPNSIRKLITKYLNEYNCPYFVFDVIEVGPDPQSVEPIIYEFKSPVVFYPLEISSTFHGQTSIDLVVFSRYLVDQRPFQDLNFLLSNFVEVNASEMQEVLPRLKQLLGKSAFLQAFRYTGRINRLRGNITAGPTMEHIGISREIHAKGLRWYFHTGFVTAILTGMFGGLLIAFICLWLISISAKGQRPRSPIRFLDGFLLGMPLGFVLASCVLYAKAYVPAKEYIFEYPFRFIYSSNDYFVLIITPLVMYYIFSIGMGFIIFCFQLGLRRRWYIGGLVYAALAIPVSYIAQPAKFLSLFNHPLLEGWINLREMGPWFIMHIAVFISLFLIARLFVWITGSRKNRRSSLS